MAPRIGLPGAVELIIMLGANFFVRRMRFDFKPGEKRAWRLGLAGIFWLLALTAMGKPIIVARSTSYFTTNGVAGFEFSISNAITVTNLGVFDADNNGSLGTNTMVGLWDAKSQALLASIEIPAGKAAPIRNHFLYKRITPITLPPGNYAVGAQYAFKREPIGYDTDITPAPEIEWVAGRVAYGNAFVFPGDSKPQAGRFIGPNFDFVPGTPLLITNIWNRAVYQRGSNNAAVIPVRGTLAGSAARVEGRAVLFDDAIGLSSDWQVVTNGAVSGVFSGTITVQAGGWYRLEFRAVDGAGQVVATYVINRIGVGEVFVTAGQSNAANEGQTRQTPDDDRVSTLDITNGWRWAYDPQPMATGTKGSVWSLFGSLMRQRYSVPVGMVCVAEDATTVGDWQPGGTNFPKLSKVMSALGPQGCRAVLWHQGEADARYSTTPSDYKAKLETLIAGSRSAAGWNVPWGVAEVSFNYLATVPHQTNIIYAQQGVVADDLGNFTGAATDDLVGTIWRYDLVHFTGTGLKAHSQRWADAVVAAMGGTIEVVLDDTDAEFTGKWATNSTIGGRFGQTARIAPTKGPLATATYRPVVPVSGSYDVWLWYPAGTTNSTNASWQINGASGTQNLTVNQQANTEFWCRVATNQFFAQGTNGTIKLFSSPGQTNHNVCADAVRLSFVSPKMFNGFTQFARDETNVSIRWTGRLSTRLQKSSVLNGAWLDVPKAMNTNAVTEGQGNNAFYRLIQR